MIKIELEQYKEDMIKNLQELIRIRSIRSKEIKGMPFGEGVHSALEFVLNLGRNLGLNVKNIDNYTGYVEVGSGDNIIGVLCHVDVVPAGDGWNHPPFEGIINNDKIYGRGAIDNKGPLISVLYSLKFLKDSGYVGDKNRIRLIIGTSEETTWECIKYYLKKESTPDISFTPDANFPVIYGEKGLLDLNLSMNFTNESKQNSTPIINLKGGESRNSIPSKCIATLRSCSLKEDYFIKKINEFKNIYKCDMLINQYDNNIIELEMKGVTGHAATPQNGVNAISYMISFLKTLDINRQCVFLEEYSKLIGLEYNCQSLKCDFEDELSGPLTFNVGTVSLDARGVNLECNIRYPISLTYRTLEDALKKAFNNSHLQLTIIEHLKPVFFSKTHPLIQTMLKYYRETTNDLISEPILIGGATYARALPNTVAFGPVFPNQKELAHQADEYITINDFFKITHIYIKTLNELNQFTHKYIT